MFGKKKQISPFDIVEISTESPEIKPDRIGVKDFFSDSSAFLMPGIILTAALILIQSSNRLLLLFEAALIFAISALLSFVTGSIPKWAKLLLSCFIAVILPLAGTVLFNQPASSVITMAPLTIGLMALWESEEIDYKWDLLIPTLLSLVTVAVGFIGSFIFEKQSVAAILLIAAMFLGVVNTFISKYFGKLLTTPSIEDYSDFPAATLGTLNSFFKTRMVATGLSLLAVILELGLNIAVNAFIPQFSNYLLYLAPVIGLLPFIVYLSISDTEEISIIEMLAIVLAIFEVVSRRGNEIASVFSVRFLLAVIAILIFDNLALGYLFVYKRRRIVVQRNQYFKGIPLIVIFISIIIGVIELVVLSMV